MKFDENLGGKGVVANVFIKVFSGEKQNTSLKSKHPDSHNILEVLHVCLINTPMWQRNTTVPSRHV